MIKVIRDSLDHCPVRTIIDIVEYKPQQKYALRLYRDHIEELSDPQKASLFEWLDAKLRFLNSLQLFTVGLQVDEVAPKYV